MISYSGESYKPLASLSVFLLHNIQISAGRKKIKPEVKVGQSAHARSSAQALISISVWFTEKSAMETNMTEWRYPY